MSGGVGGPSSERGRQALLVALCVLGLVVAATALGPAADGGGFQSGGEIDLSDLLSLFVDGEQSHASCRVTFLDDPVPGDTVTVLVVSGSGPVADARVWLNDRAIGRTNETGRVAGRVPYERPIEIRAQVPDGTDCTAEGEASFDRGALGAAAGGTTALGATPAATAAGGSVAASTPVNVTRTVTTEGRIDIAVTERPDPGETVSLVARIRGRPVPDATVTVDGHRAGETDDHGQYALAVPDDGSERVRVTVERGDYRGRTTVTVALLHASVAPSTVVAVPTYPAALNVTLGREPVPGATVTLDGERIGETDADGHLRITLPSDPTATIRVRAADQTTTVSMAHLYAGATGLVGVVLLVLGAVGLTLVRRVPTPDGVPETDRIERRIRRLLNRLVRRALALATWLTELVDDAETRLRAFWRTLRTSPLAALRHLRALPGTVAGALAALWRWLYALPAKLTTLRSSGDGGTATGSARPTGAARPTSHGDPTTLRERWRTFARWVMPDRWQQRTPGEVARAATAEGYPREAVTDLATAFREVEYGGATPTERHERRTREAFDALAAHRRAEGASVPSGTDEADRPEGGDR